MKGQVLGFDGSTGAITGDGGERFTFALADWKGEKPPQPRDNVDFVAKDGVATDIYPTATAFGAAFSGLGDGLKGAGTGAGGLAMIAERPQVVLEALALLTALMLPYLSVMIGSFTMIGLPGLLNSEMSMGGGFGALGPLSYLLYLIPIGAIAGLFLDFTGKRNTMLELGLGGLCIFALVYYFLLLGAISSGPFGSMAARAFSLGFGGWLIVLIGIGLIMTGLGKLKRIPGL